MEQKVPIEEVCNTLEIPINSWAVNGHLNVEQAKTALEEFKAIVKKQKIVLSKKYHPDKIGGNEEKLKKINATVDLVIKLEITILKQKPRTIKFHFSSNPFGSSGSNDNSTTSSATFFRF